MKKIVFGSALMICGIIAACTESLKQTILFAEPSVLVVGENYLLSWGGRIAFVIGLILCIIGLFSRNDNNENGKK